MPFFWDPCVLILGENKLNAARDKICMMLVMEKLTMDLYYYCVMVEKLIESLSFTCFVI